MSAYVEAFFPRAEEAERNDDFAARVRDSQRRVFQIAYSVLANPADAEEVAQEVFLRAYQNLRTLRDPARFRAWVNRIAFRLALNLQRTRHRQLARDTAWHDLRPNAAGASAAREGAGGGEDLLNRLRGEIDRLPEKLRTVVLLCTVEDMDARTTAAVLGIPVGTVRSRLHLARKRLLEALNP